LATAPNTEPEFRNLKEYDLANSPRGLLLRYARGRTRSVGFRTIVIICGVALTWVYTDLALALLVLVIMSVFELAEHTILKRILRQRLQGIALAQATPVVVFATTLQAIGIGISIAIVAAQGDSARLTAWVFLIGVTLNSLLVARYHPASHFARMLVYLVTVVAIILHQAIIMQAPTILIGTEIVSFALLAYMFTSLFNNISHRENRMLTAGRSLINQSQQAHLSNLALQKSQASLAKRESEARRLALVAEHATDSVILTDTSSKILWVNSQFSRITGYSLHEALGRQINTLLDGQHTDGKTSAKFIAARKQCLPFQGTILNHRKDGSTVWMAVSQTPVFDDHGQLIMYISVERDATATMEKQAELRKALAAATLADKEKTDFLARMSHELRTPSNGIVGSVGMMAETDLSQEQQEILTILEQGSNRMQVVIDDILSFCELSTENPPIQLEEIDLLALIQKSADTKIPEAKAKGLDGPFVHLPKAGNCLVLSDRTLLKRIFHALIGNAVKFTEKGRVDVTVRLKHKRNRISIEVDVCDTGIGILAKDKKRIFNKFTQVDGKRTRKYDGAGLGLSIALSSAHKLGGDITVCKKAKIGSSFTIFLSLETAKETAEPPTVTALNNPDLTLLVAEDNRTNRLLISQMLKGAALQLEFAEDGIQAVEKYEQLKPNLMLMDISMPHKDGLQATREIRRFEDAHNLPACKILALTANTFKQDRKNCYDAGMNAFLAKPVRKQKLIEALEAALGSGP